MTLSPLALLAVCGLPLVLGLALLRALGFPARDRLAAFGFAHLAGQLVVGLVLVAWLACGVPASAVWIDAVLLGLAAAAIARSRRPAEIVSAPAAARREEWLLAAVLALALALYGAAALRATLRPMALGEGDEAWNWGLKAMVLHDVGELGGEYAARLRAFPQANADYPLLNPLLQVWTFAHAGRIVHVESRFPIQLAGAALLVLAAAALRRRVRPAQAALLVLVLAAASMTVRLGGSAGSDVMVALGLLGAVEALSRWRASGERVWLRLAALALAFLVWSKNEGLLHALVVALVWLPGRRRLPREALAWALLPLGVAAGTAWFNASSGFAASDLAFHDTQLAEIPGRIAETVRFFARLAFLRPASHGGVFAVLVVLTVLVPRRAWRGAAARSAATAWVLIAALVLVYAASPRDLNWHLHHSAERVLYPLVPLVLLWLAEVLASARAPEAVSAEARAVATGV